MAHPVDPTSSVTEACIHRAMVLPARCCADIEQGDLLSDNLTMRKQRRNCGCYWNKFRAVFGDVVALSWWQIYHSPN